jgi:myosin protein heavy chain
MFVLEQEEYGRERIDWQVVNFGLDLQPTIELIGSMQPMGILATLDDACIMPKATDLTFLQRVKQDWIQPEGKQAVHAGTKNLEATRFSNGFIVKHYAGRVEYNTDGWLQKNKDPINDSVAGLLSRSGIPAIANLFADYAESTQGQGAATGAKRVKRGAFRTTSQRHKEQLDSLIRQLQATQPHFVRCIVPNSNKKPRQMDVPLVLDQLRCNGVLEGIRIARLGYPNRLPFTEFRNRYEVLAPGVVPPGYMDGRKASVKIVESLDLFPGSFKMGLTKIFFKAGVLAELEERRDGHLYDIFSRFQSVARRHTAHRKMKKYLNRANAVRTIQRNARAYNELRDWPWWQLFNQVKPLLGATREDEEIARRKQELALATERAELEKAANAKLEEERQKLEVEKKAMVDNLETMKLSLEEKDQVVQNHRQRESEQQEEIKALKDDIDLLEEQLEQTQSQNMTLKSKYDALVVEYQAHMDKDKSHAEEQTMWQNTASDLSKGLAEARLKVVVLEEARDTAIAGKQELERTLQRLREDVGRLKDKTLAAEEAAESKVVEERSKRCVEYGSTDSN